MNWVWIKDVGGDLTNIVEIYSSCSTLREQKYQNLECSTRLADGGGLANGNPLISHFLVYLRPSFGRRFLKTLASPEFHISLCTQTLVSESQSYTQVLFSLNTRFQNEDIRKYGKF